MFIQSGQLVSTSVQSFGEHGSRLDLGESDTGVDASHNSKVPIFGSISIESSTNGKFKSESSISGTGTSSSSKTPTSDKLTRDKSKI